MYKQKDIYKLIIQMVSGKEYVIIDEAEMIDCYVADINQSGRRKINANGSNIFIDKIESYTVRIDTDSMS